MDNNISFCDLTFHHRLIVGFSYGLIFSSFSHGLIFTIVYIIVAEFLYFCFCKKYNILERAIVAIITFAGYVIGSYIHKRGVILFDHRLDKSKLNKCLFEQYNNKYIPSNVYHNIECY